MAVVIIADDEAQVRAFLSAALARAGYDVLEAVHGGEALERACGAAADLVITDIVMPEMEGLETIMTLRRMRPGVKILAISGGGRIGPRDYLAAAARLGADHVLEKPFSAAALLDVVRALIGPPGRAE
jgi:CheY-like chemotaxis protein